MSHKKYIRTPSAAVKEQGRMWRIATQKERKFTVLSEILEATQIGFQLSANFVLTEPASEPINYEHFTTTYFKNSRKHGFWIGEKFDYTAPESEHLRKNDTIEDFYERANGHLSATIKKYTMKVWPKDKNVDDYVPRWFFTDDGVLQFKSKSVATGELKKLLPPIFYEFGVLETAYGLGLDVSEYLEDYPDSYGGDVQMVIDGCAKKMPKKYNTESLILDPPDGCVSPLLKKGELRRKWIFRHAECDIRKVPKAKLVEHLDKGISLNEIKSLFNNVLLPQLTMSNWKAGVERNVNDFNTEQLALWENKATSLEVVGMTFFPDVILQLMGWRPEQLSNGAIKNFGKSISMRLKTPPIRLEELPRNVLTVQKDSVSTLVGGLPTSETDTSRLRSFYYYGGARHSVYTPTNKSEDKSIITFSLPNTGTRLYNLSETYIELEGRIVNEDWTSLFFGGTIVASKEIKQLIIKSIVLKMGSRVIIDDSSNLYSEREQMLNLIYDPYPNVKPHFWEKISDARRALVDGSIYFTLQIYPFKFKNVPLYYCNGDQFDLTVTLNPTPLFINHLEGTDKRKLRFAPSKIQLLVEQADVNPETAKLLLPFDFSACRVNPWTHHYIDSDILTASGKTEPIKTTFYKTKALLKNGGAKKYFVVLKRLRTETTHTMNDNESVPLKFESFNLNEMKLLEGTDVIGQPIRIGGLDCNLPAGKLYKQYQKHCKKAVPIKHQDFCRDSLIFIFERGDAVKTVASPKIELLFRNPIEFDLQVIIMASYDESYEIYGWGHVRNIKQLLPESAIAFKKNETTSIADAEASKKASEEFQKQMKEIAARENTKPPTTKRSVGLDKAAASTIKAPDVKRPRGRPPTKQLE